MDVPPIIPGKVNSTLMKLNGRVIGPNHTINWPATSPDAIYKDVPFQNLEELKNAISAACNQISPYQLRNVRNEVYDRLGYCLAVDGGLFEHLIKKSKVSLFVWYNLALFFVILRFLFSGVFHFCSEH